MAGAMGDAGKARGVSRRDLLRQSLVLGGAAFLGAACTSSPSTSPTSSPAATSSPSPTGTSPTATDKPSEREVSPVSFGIATAGAYTWPTFVATDLDLWRKHGVDMSMAVGQGGGTLVQQLLGEAVAIGGGTPDQLALAIEEGAPLIGVCGDGLNVPWSLLVREDVDSFEDLRGGVFAVSTLQGGNSTFLRIMLEENGLTEGVDYELVAGGGTSERVAGLQGGQYSGALLIAPFDFVLEEGDLKILDVTTNYVQDYQFGVLAVREDWLPVDENREVLRRFIKARLEAEDFIVDPSNREQASQILAEATETELEHCLATWDLYMDQNVRWNDVEVSGIQVWLDAYEREFRPVEDWLDLSILRDAKS